MITETFTFQGKHQDEVVLYVSRMHRLALIKNIILICLAAGMLLYFLWTFGRGLVGFILPTNMLIITTILIVAAWIFSLWWAWVIWSKNYFVITDRRLVKLGYHSPFTSYQLSANLSELQDSAATSRSVLEQILGIGTFYARTSAAAIFDFHFEYLPFHRDLHNYVNKLLYTLKHDPNATQTLKSFRPFIPKNRGERY
ncbi:MAG: hypothetical protein Q8R11_01795 [bacterium]|nr:hypothetical protein [bacterium]